MKNSYFIGGGGGTRKGKKSKKTGPHTHPGGYTLHTGKGGGAREGAAAPVRGLLIHIFALFSVHILRGLHPKHPSEGVGGWVGPTRC